MEDKVMRSLIEGFNSFFIGTAEAKINGNVLEIRIGSQTLLISLPEVIGGDSMGRSQQS